MCIRDRSSTNDLQQTVQAESNLQDVAMIVARTHRNREPVSYTHLDVYKRQPYTWLIDCWTPAGMLSMNLTDSVRVQGNLWQDWHISPQKPR